MTSQRSDRYRRKQTILDERSQLPLERSCRALVRRQLPLERWVTSSSIAVLGRTRRHRLQINYSCSSLWSGVTARTLPETTARTLPETPSGAHCQTLDVCAWTRHRKVSGQICEEEHPHDLGSCAF